MNYELWRLMMTYMKQLQHTTGGPELPLPDRAHLRVVTEHPHCSVAAGLGHLEEKP